MHVKLISWIAILTVFTTFIIQENPFSVTKGPKEVLLPSVNLKINANSDSIEISNQNASQADLLLYTFLSKTLFIAQNDLERVILENGEMLDINSMNSSKFDNLDANSTYYLYYFQQDLNLKYKSPIYSQTIQTQPIKIIPLAPIIFNANTIMIIAIITSILLATAALYSQYSQYKLTKKLKSLTIQQSPKCCSIKNIEIQQLKRITQAKIYEFEEKNLCGLCCDRPREVIFLSCGHIYTCGQCAKNLVQCPLDKKYISAKFSFRICDKFGINANYINKLEVNSLKQRKYDHLGLSYDKVKEYLDDAKKYDLLKEKFDNYNYFEKCIKCNQQRKDTFFVDCGHLVCCRGCAETVDYCPIDHVGLTNKVPVYFA